MSETETVTESAEETENKEPGSDQATGVQAEGAIDPAEAALKEFEEAAKASKASESTREQTADSGDQTASSPQPIDNEKLDAAIEARLEFKQTVDNLTKTVRGDAAVDDDFVLSWIDRKVAKDPRLKTAFGLRSSNPDAWNAVQVSLAKEFQKNFTPAESNVDENATADREALAATVRGTSTTAHEEKPVDLSSMPPHEFEAYKEKLFNSG